jgi:tripartite-type tricarboxylate transporter receptor subunit TctC
MAFACALSLGNAIAQSYPSKPIRLLSYSGAAVEALMRLIGHDMQANMGQPLVIENRSGANGIIAGEACARAPADGYTLCMVDRSFVILPLTVAKLPFDVNRDFAPVTNVVYTVLALAAYPSVGATNLKELVSVARARPGELNMASLGPTTLANMLREWMQKEYGISMAHIPYKNPGALMTAMLSGETQLTYFGLANFTQHHATGKIRVIAINGSSRSPLVPDVATLVEQGITSIDTRVWFGWFAPAGTPRDVRDRIYREVQKVVNVPAFREKNFTSQAMEAIANSPDEFAQFIKTDVVYSAALLKLSGAKPE